MDIPLPLLSQRDPVLCKLLTVAESDGQKVIRQQKRPVTRTQRRKPCCIEDFWPVKFKPTTVIRLILSGCAAEAETGDGREFKGLLIQIPRFGYLRLTGIGLTGSTFQKFDDRAWFFEPHPQILPKISARPVICPESTVSGD